MAGILDKFNVRGRTALVTGGGRGLGWAMSCALAEAGANIMLSGRGEATLEKAQTELASRYGVEAAYCVTDHADRASTENLVREAQGRFGCIDILVHNAAVFTPQSALEVSDQSWDATLEVDLSAAMVMARGLVPKMREQRWGRVIYISSVGSVLSTEYGQSAYGAAKAALHGLARTQAVELARDNVTVNCLLLGSFESDLSSESQSAGTIDYDIVKRHSPMGRWGKPEELAGAVLLLASEAGSYITGSSLAVDGGFTVYKK